LGGEWHGVLGDEGVEHLPTMKATMESPREKMSEPRDMMIRPTTAKESELIALFPSCRSSD